MKKILVIIFFVFFSIFLTGCNNDIDEAHTEGLVFELIDGRDAYAVIDYTGDASEVHIDSHYNSLPVIKIDRDAFLGLSHVTSIELPDTIEELGWYCFQGTSIPKEITVPDKVYYFGSCYNIDTVVHVSENHMYHKEMVVDGVNTIVTKDEKELIFVNRRLVDRLNREEETYHVPSTITKVGDFAMYYTDFTNIIVPDQVTDIGNGAFRDADCEVNIPTQVEIIGDYAYVNCRFTGELVLPEGLEEIGSWAFNMNEITEIVFPSTLTTLRHGPCYSSSNEDKSNNVTRITFKSWKLDEKSRNIFKGFILNNYRESLIEEITVVLPEDEVEAEELRARLEEALDIANNAIDENWGQKRIIFE